VAGPGAVMVSSTAESGFRTRIDLEDSEEDIRRRVLCRVKVEVGVG